VETIGSKQSYALTWCMPNNDDDDDVNLGMHVPRDSPEKNPLKFFERGVAA